MILLWFYRCRSDRRVHLQVINILEVYFSTANYNTSFEKDWLTTIHIGSYGWKHSERESPLKKSGHREEPTARIGWRWQVTILLFVVCKHLQSNVRAAVGLYAMTKDCNGLSSPDGNADSDLYAIIAGPQTGSWVVARAHQFETDFLSVWSCYQHAAIEWLV